MIYMYMYVHVYVYVHVRTCIDTCIYLFLLQACEDGNCVNLLANVTGTHYDGQLSGEPYVTWDVKVTTPPN